MTAAKPPFSTIVRPYGTAAIKEAAALIREGHPVATPTETVYGLAGDATSGRSVAAIYAAKGRPAFNPLIIHVADGAMARSVARFDDTADRLADAFWPGPLTLVLPSAEQSPVASLATAGLATVAVRMPAHPAMQALIAAVGRPLAAPSANASGSISPTRAKHVLRSLDGRIPMVIDAGATEAGLESTIMAVAERLRLLRPGPIAGEMIVAVLERPVETTAEGQIEAPGQLASHYAPDRPVRLEAETALPGEYLIGFGAVAGDASLSEAGDLAEAATRLFDMLHRADQSGASAIAVAPIPNRGLGVAINDRLTRAAAPR